MIDDSDPQFITINTPYVSDCSICVESVNFDCSGLSISICSGNWDIVVVFEQTHGFRVLDELDLCAFWSHVTLADGWIFEVIRGGWKDLELQRKDFISGQLDWVHEYLIIGRNECVSVLSKEKFTIMDKSASSD